MRIVFIAVLATLCVIAQLDKTMSAEAQQRPTVAVIVSEFEYETYDTLPAFARRYLGKDFHVVYLVNDDIDNHDLDGIEMLKDADLAVISIWRRTLPPDQLQIVRDYVAANKPLVAIRTSCHAFATRSGETPEGRATWQRFDRDVLACNYHGHHGNRVAKGDSPTQAWIVPAAAQHRLVSGLPSGEFPVGSALYKTEPLEARATPLLMGRYVDYQPHEPLAWSVESDGRSRVFFTSMGSPRDFQQKEFVQLLLNAVYWAMEMELPAEIRTP